MKLFFRQQRSNFNAKKLANLQHQCFEAPQSQYSESDMVSFIKNPTITILATSESLVIFQLAADQAEIISIGVIPQKRRQRLGSSLIDRLTSHCLLRQIKAIHLEVEETNIAALSFYNKCNFIKTGVRKNYYKNSSNLRSHAVLMKKSL